MKDKFKTHFGTNFDTFMDDAESSDAKFTAQENSEETKMSA